MNKSKVLMVEDDPQVSQAVARYLDGAGYEVTILPDGPQALEHVQQQGLPHIALIGLELPGMHGFELADRLRSMADVPIIFVAFTDDKDTIIQGLTRYAEDFIVKPFELRELEARIQIVLSRMPSFDYASEPVIHVDDNLSIDFAHNRVVVGGKTMRLTPTESGLLYVLLHKAGQVVENRTLIARVWPGHEHYEDTLRVHIHRLRRKLEADSHHPHYIRTERSIGYRFARRPISQANDRA